MAVTFGNDNEKSFFQRYPFLSLGVFFAILGVGGEIFFRGTLISMRFFMAIPLLIVIKLLCVVFRSSRHPLTKAFMAGLLISMALFLIGVILMNLVPESALYIWEIVVRIPALLGVVALLMRIFMAIFIEKF